jgi:hypothetical protein
VWVSRERRARELKSIGRRRRRRKEGWKVRGQRLDGWEKKVEPWEVKKGGRKGELFICVVGSLIPMDRYSRNLPSLGWA